MAGKNSGGLSLGLIGFTVALAGGSLAQAPDPANPAAVTAWASALKISARTTAPSADWQSLGAVSDGLLMAGVLSGRNEAGAATLGVRLELFEPLGDVRSQMSQFDLDCKAQTIRQSASLSFTANNLGGSKQEQAVTDDWQPVEDYAIFAPAIQKACAETPVAASGTPDYRDASAVVEWMRLNGVNPTGPTSPWLQVGFTPEGVIQSQRRLLGEVMTSRTTPRVVMRLERFVPAPLRGGEGTTLSQTMEYEVNCVRNEVREVIITQYPNRNLTGRANVYRLENPQWTPFTANQMMASAFDDICRAVGA